MKLSEAIDGFILFRQGNRKGDLSPNTIKLYRKLIAYLDDPDVNQISSDMFAEFMRHLAGDYRQVNGSPLSTYSQDNYWKAIRSFWKWAAENLKTEPVHFCLFLGILV